MAQKRKTFAEIVTETERKTQRYNFMGHRVDIKPLSVAEVREFQQAVRDEGDDPDGADERGLSAQRDLIRTAVVGAEDISDDALDQLPLAEITALANEILRAGGLSNPAGND